MLSKNPPLPDWDPKVLTQDEIRQFIDWGYVLIRGAFPADLAEEIVDIVWSRIEPDRCDRSTWTANRIGLNQFVEGAPFTRVYTEQLRGAVDDLLGAGRWTCPNRSGWWPLTFPGFAEKPWFPPELGWHVDGFHQHTLTAPDEGLLGLMIFYEIGEGDGGTAVSLGSHKLVTRILAEAGPLGLPSQEAGKLINQHRPENIIEATGSPGDVYLCHPFMRHSASMNTGNSVRIITNKCFPLDEPMNLWRDRPEDFSTVEYSIVAALRECGSPLWHPDEAVA